jgi:hypothetical protein
MSTSWWVSCNKFTVGVTTDDAKVITDAPPIVKKFIGQPLDNLLRWAKKFGGLETIGVQERQEEKA